MDYLWLVCRFIHNFFENLRFLLWTYLPTRATLPSVRESAEEVLFVVCWAREAERPYVIWPMQSRSFRGRCGASGPHGRVRFPRWRQDAFGRSNAKGGTETGSSDRGVQSVAACGPPRFQDVTRCGGDAAGASGTRSRRSDGPAASVCPSRKTRQAEKRQAAADEAAAVDQVAGPPSFAGCLPVPGGSEVRRACARRAGAAPATRWQAPRIVAVSPGTARRAPRRDRACSSACVSTGGDTAVETRSIRRRQRLRQGVCRFLDGARVRFRGREPVGSERRRVELCSGGPTNSGMQARRLSYNNLPAISQPRIPLNRRIILGLYCSFFDFTSAETSSSKRMFHAVAFIL